MYEFARRWVKKDHNVTIITAPYEKSDVKAVGFIKKSSIADIDLIIINSPDSNRHSTLIRGLSAARFAVISVWYALTLKYDVVLASSGPITVGIPALASKWLRRKRMIFEVRDLWPQGAVELGKLHNQIAIKVAYRFERLCYQNSSLIVSCSDGMNKSIIERFPDLKTTVIPNASDVELFSPKTTIIDHKSYKSLKYFIYAGSLGFMDDCIQFIKAAMQISRDDIKFIIIGEGSERKYLEAYSKANQNIKFLGLLPKEEVVLWYRKAWVSLMTFKNYPVLQTNSPNKMFDSFAAGVPVIQNTQGWIKDLFESEGCGLTVPQENNEKFVEAILLLADNPSLRNRLAENAFRLANSMFSREKLAEEYIHAIEAL